MMSDHGHRLKWCVAPIREERCIWCGASDVVDGADCPRCPCQRCVVNELRTALRETREILRIVLDTRTGKIKARAMLANEEHQEMAGER